MSPCLRWGSADGEVPDIAADPFFRVPVLLNTSSHVISAILVKCFWSISISLRAGSQTYGSVCPPRRPSHSLLGLECQRTSSPSDLVSFVMPVLCLMSHCPHAPPWDGLSHSLPPYLPPLTTQPYPVVSLCKLNSVAYCHFWLKRIWLKIVNSHVFKESSE